MSRNVNAPITVASGRPTPTPMPAAAPVEIPLLASCVDVQDGSLAAVVLVLVADVPVVDVDAVGSAVAPLSNKSVDKAALITALYAPTVKFCLEQLSRLLHAKTREAHAHTPAWASAAVEEGRESAITFQTRVVIIPRWSRD